MSDYVTIRRWSLKEGFEETQLVDLVRSRIIPAYKQQPGCLRLELLRVREPSSYMAITRWESRAAYDRWAGDEGQAWRDAYRATLEQWIEMMIFQEEWETDSLISE